MLKKNLLAGVATGVMLATLPLSTNIMPFGLGTSAAQAQDVRVSFDIFFDELEPHGVWVRHPRYRYVWCPEVDADWRPYTHGRWVYLRDYGWYFASDEPFAWAVYHYGRWHDDDDLGWCWVPGRNWAPAWVAWRRGGDHVGWAPLPPEEEGFQISVSVNFEEDDLEPDDWFFVRARDFTEPNLSINISFGTGGRDRDRDRDHDDWYRESEYVGPVVIQNNIVINNIIDIDFIQQQTEQEVQVVEAASVSEPEQAAANVDDGTVEIFAPQTEEPTEESAPAEAVEPEQAAEMLPQAQAEAGTEAEAEGDTEAGADTAADTEADVEADAEAEAGTDGDTATGTETEAEAGTEAEGTVEEETSTEDEEAAPAEGEDAAPVTECPEGEELVDGVCVPIEAAVETEAKAGAEADAAAGTNEAAPTEEAAPEQETAPAEDVSEDEPAPAEEAAPEEQPAAEEAVPEDAAPADEEAAPEDTTDEAPAIECPEGQVPYEGRCIPIEEAEELGIL